MAWILTPAQERNSRGAPFGIVLLLVFSALALSVAPVMMPDGYSWITHTTSESAAQNLEGAWLARLGFLLLGMAVTWLAGASKTTWALGAYWMHLSFAVFMLSTAVFSHQPWLSGVAFDPMEDMLHSITATAMGFAFSFGVLFRLMQRWQIERRVDIVDAIALLSAILIPFAMLFLSDLAGLMQRGMFLVAYLWYVKEALVLQSHKRSTGHI